MAERRMFSQIVTDSDRFLDMSAGAQLLYFHLSMSADDDGFVGRPKAVLRQCALGQDSLAELVSQGYIIAFDSGVVVIRHWKMNNQIRSDRYHTTVYEKEMSRLCLNDSNVYYEKQNTECEKTEDAEPDDDLPFGPGDIIYSQKSEPATVSNSIHCEPATVSNSINREPATVSNSIHCEPATVSNSINREPATISNSINRESATISNSINREPATEDSIGKDSIVKDSLVKDRVAEDIKSADVRGEHSNAHADGRMKYGEYSNVLLTAGELQQLKNEFPHNWNEKLERLSTYMATSGKKYSNHLATIRSWARQDIRSNPKKADLYAPEDSVDDLFGIGE